MNRKWFYIIGSVLILGIVSGVYVGMLDTREALAKEYGVATLRRIEAEAAVSSARAEEAEKKSTLEQLSFQETRRVTGFPFQEVR